MYFHYLLVILKIISNCWANSFIDDYLSPSIRPFCSEVQEKLQFKYSFRGRKEKNVNSHVVYLFTEDDKVFSINQMTGALNTNENNRFVIPEIFFNEVKVKTSTEFWDGKQTNDVYNSVFSDPYNYGLSFWLFGDQYRPVKVNDKEFKVTEVKDPIGFAQSEYGFMKNSKIKAKGFQNIIGIDMADTGTPAFLPIRVYVRDTNLENEGNAISFAFYNKTEENEEFENGKHYKYGFNTAAYLVTASTSNPKYNNYFELRTRKGKFSLFDFTYNRDYLLSGATEELLGCPPSFCNSREFDDILRLKDGTKLLYFREWFWPFKKPGQRIAWEEAVISNISSRKHISKSANFPKPFQFGIRHVVDGSFIDDSILYIFRNGSYISSTNDSIVNSLNSFTDYKPMEQLFKGVPSERLDALFYHKESRTVFFIKDDKYWSFSMEHQKLSSNDFPKHVENLGLPYDFKVRSTYVEEDDSGKQIEFYLFTENRYIVFKSTEFNDGRFIARKHTYYCTSVNFFGCSEEQFVCPELPAERKESLTPYTFIILAIIFLILVVFFILVASVIITIASKSSSTKDKPKNKITSDSDEKDNKSIANTVMISAKRSKL